jgi:hypothetical protein
LRTTGIRVWVCGLRRKNRSYTETKRLRAEPDRLISESGFRETGMSASKLNLRPLKEFAYQNLSPDMPLRSIILAEDNEIDAATFLARLKIWLQLTSIQK